MLLKIRRIWAGIHSNDCSLLSHYLALWYDGSFPSTGLRPELDSSCWRVERIDSITSQMRLYIGFPEIASDCDQSINHCIRWQTIMFVNLNPPISWYKGRFVDKRDDPPRISEHYSGLQGYVASSPLSFARVACWKPIRWCTVGTRSGGGYVRKYLPDLSGVSNKTNTLQFDKYMPDVCCIWTASQSHSSCFKIRPRWITGASQQRDYEE